MIIYLATDHRGFKLKEQIKAWLKDWNYECEDLGAFNYDPDDDYPDFIRKAAEKVSQDPEISKAIILGGSGQGEAIMANRFKNVRASVYYGGEEEVIKMSREHNDSNILSLGASFLSEEETQKAVKLWLDTSFSEEERHKRRIEKIDL